MNRLLFVIAALAILAGTGCHTRYQVTLNSGGGMTAYSKPKLVGGAYVFKDASGQETQVPAGKVRSIERK